MIVLVTDFGIRDPYLGQMQAVLLQKAPGVSSINLFPELPDYSIQTSAYLLAAYIDEFPEGTVFLCVVDPGVGTERDPVIIEADGRWFVGPDNGLFDIIKRRTAVLRQWRITYRPPRCSDSFHGRDIFAPVAAGIAQGEPIPGELISAEPVSGGGWPEDLTRLVYCDHYGNAMTGIRGSSITNRDRFRIVGQELGYARTFGEVTQGGAFWHINANGLVEFAMNQADITQALGLSVGMELEWLKD